MKALILAGGKGTRLHPLTETMPKQLVPVANKPILYHVLDQVRMAGVTDAAVITSPENHLKIKEAVGCYPEKGLKITCIVQDEPAGLAHAVKTASGYLGNSDFLMFLGDNLIYPDVSTISSFRSSPADAVILVKEVQNPRQYGVAVLDEKNCIKSIVEKPQNPPSNMAVLGIYFFRSIIHEAIKRIEPSWRGELEITDAIQELINMGRMVKADIFQGWWIDTGKMNDILQANCFFLDECGEAVIEGIVDRRSIVSGAVEVGRGSLIESSIIRGPVIIGADCKIINSVIGPYSSIGSYSELNGAAVKNSVLLPGCILETANLINSLIGACTKITAPCGKNEEISLLVGNNCNIVL